MSSTLSNIQLGTSVATLDGLAVIEADQLYVNGQPITSSPSTVSTTANSSNSIQAIVFTPSFGTSTNALLFVDGTFGLGYTPATDTLFSGQITTTGCVTANTLKINSVPSGTVSKTLAVDASGNVIQGSSASTTVATTLGTSGTTYYLTMANSAGTNASNTLFCDASTGYDLTYVPSTSGTNGTLYGNVIQFNDAIFTTLKLTAVLSGTISYILGITSTGQVVTTTSSSQPTITTLTSSYHAYPLFALTSGTVPNSPVYVEGNGVYWDHTSQTFSVTNLAVTGTMPNPTITAGSSGLGYLLFGNAGTNQSIYTSLAYDALYQSLLVGNGTFSSLLSNSSKFIIGSGNARSQIALQLPMYGACVISFGSYVSIIFASASAVTFVKGQQVIVSGLTVNTGLNATYTLDVASANGFTTSDNPSGLPSGTGGYGASAIVSFTPINYNMQFTSTSAIIGIGATPILTAGTTGITVRGTTQLQAKDTDNSVTISCTLTNLNPLILSSVYNANYQYSGTTQGDATIICGASIYMGVGANKAINFMIDIMNPLKLEVSHATLASQYLLLNAVTNPYINIGGNSYMGFATSIGSFINDAVVGDFCISSRAGNIRMSNGYAKTDFLVSTAQVGCQLGSMFNFSTAGTWDNSNCFYVNTNGSTSAGVGIGFSTTDSTGYLVSIAPNVVWKTMSYKALTHEYYTSGNNHTLSIRDAGMYSYNNLHFINNGFGIYWDGVNRGLGSSNTLFGTVTTLGTNQGAQAWDGYNMHDRYTFMCNGDSYGLYDSNYGWLIRSVNTTAYLGDTNVNVCIQSRQQTGTYNQILIGGANIPAEWGVLYSAYTANTGIGWGGGYVITSFYKASANSKLRVSGNISYFCNPGMSSWRIYFANTSIGYSYAYDQNQYTNVGSNHSSHAVMIEASGLAVGSYNVLLVAVSNIYTDGNDAVHLLSEIVPS